MRTSCVLAVAALLGSTTAAVLAAPAAPEKSVARPMPYPAQLTVTTISEHEVEVAQAWADRGGMTARRSQHAALANRRASVAQHVARHDSRS